MSTADHILDQIDGALHDDVVGPDAMRSRPKPEVRIPKLSIRREDGEWEELPGVGNIQLTLDDEPGGGNVAFVTVTVDTTAIQERLREVQDFLRRMAEAFKPAAENAAKAVDSFTRAFSAPARPKVPGRPAWQSPYGPGQRRR